MTDEKLLHSCLSGDVEEYHKIVERYGSKAMAIAMNILGNREDAEDASQDTFIQVYKNLDKFDFKRSFPNWFYSILYKRCLDRLRKRSRFFTFFQRIKTEPSQSFHAQPANPGDDLFEKQEMMKSLNPKERLSLFLWANDGYTSEEIGEVLKCSASTARVFLFKARKKIKAFLEKENVAV
jgi:RNA polymerase sigma-70 factor (ECF subfamily)